MSQWTLKMTHRRKGGFHANSPVNALIIYRETQRNISWSVIFLCARLFAIQFYNDLNYNITPEF